MKNFLKIKYLLLVGILVLSVVVRSHNLTSVPRHGATFDEYAWTWLGINLIEKHTPISWSSHPQYIGHRYAKVYQGAEFWIVNPYLEHPPLFGLVAGSFAVLNGAHQMFDIDLQIIRPLGLLLGLLSVFMVFLFVREFYDDRLALLSAFLYSIVPTVAIGSRLVQNENFFIPFFLLSLVLVNKFLKTHKPIFRNLAALTCGLLLLAKIPWIAAAASICMILFYNGKYKDVLKFVSVVILFFAIYLLYGIHFNSHLFFDLWRLQLQRYDIAFNSFLAAFTTPLLADRYYLDGWVYFGWLAFVLLLIKDFRKNYFLIFGMLGYMLVFIFAIPNEPGHGWYRYPFLPFLIISTAIFLRDYFNKNNVLTFLFFIVVGLSMFQNSWAINFGFSFLVFRFALFLFGLGLLPLFIKSQKIVGLTKFANVISLVLVFVLSIWSVYSFQDL